MAASHEQHLQKALDRMNLKIHAVLSDLTGVSGLKMIQAIKGRRGGLLANLALARKLGELFWRLLVHGSGFVEQGR